MNKKLEDYKKYIKTKRVAVLGMGISNTPLIKYLANLGVNVTGFDMAEPAELKGTLNELKDYEVNYCLGKNYLSNLKGFDVIFKTPKVRFDIPELLMEKERGAVVTSEMEVFVDLCPAKIFGITGSDGKTTTTTLVYKMLTEAGYKCWLGGNIGTPLLSKIDEIQEEDKVVLELSSFQLHTMNHGTDIAVVTNLSPNHLDVHKSMEEYVDAKKNIFLNQREGGRVVLNYDNDITRGYTSEVRSNVVYFSRLNELEQGAFLKDGALYYREGNEEVEIVKAKDILLLGDHNIENYLAAIAAVKGYVTIDAMKRIATTFTGVEHRMEPVRKLHGVTFYNDSIGSSPTRTIAGLKAFDKKVILIAGGYDKKIPYDEMAEVLVEKVKVLILIGTTGPKIGAVLQDEIARSGRGKDVHVFSCSTLEEAVKTAYNNAAEGDAVVLSPASASFDMFKNFEERGNKFKEIVNNL